MSFQSNHGVMSRAAMQPGCRWITAPTAPLMSFPLSMEFSVSNQCAGWIRLHLTEYKNRLRGNNDHYLGLLRLPIINNSRVQAGERCVFYEYSEPKSRTTNAKQLKSLSAGDARSG